MNAQRDSFLNTFTKDAYNQTTPGKQIRGAGAMMKINIDELTEAELIDLNHRVVERLRFLSQMRAHKQMLGFKIGDRVTFQPEGSPQATGMLTRYNKKTVTVITDDGMHWNVSPSLLRRAESPGNMDFGKSNLIPLKKR